MKDFEHREAQWLDKLNLFKALSPEEKERVMAQKGSIEYLKRYKRRLTQRLELGCISVSTCKDSIEKAKRDISNYYLALFVKDLGLDRSCILNYFGNELDSYLHKDQQPAFCSRNTINRDRFELNNDTREDYASLLGILMGKTRKYGEDCTKTIYLTAISSRNKKQLIEEFSSYVENLTGVRPNINNTSQRTTLRSSNVSLIHHVLASTNSYQNIPLCEVFSVLEKKAFLKNFFASNSSKKKNYLLVSSALPKSFLSDLVKLCLSLGVYVTFNEDGWISVSDSSSLKRLVELGILVDGALELKTEDELVPSIQKFELYENHQASGKTLSNPQLAAKIRVNTNVISRWNRGIYGVKLNNYRVLRDSVKLDQTWCLRQNIAELLRDRQENFLTKQDEFKTEDLNYLETLQRDLEFVLGHGKLTTVSNRLQIQELQNFLTSVDKALETSSVQVLKVSEPLNKSLWDRGEPRGLFAVESGPPPKLPKHFRARSSVVVEQYRKLALWVVDEFYAKEQVSVNDLKKTVLIEVTRIIKAFSVSTAPTVIEDPEFPVLFVTEIRIKIMEALS